MRRRDFLRGAGALGLALPALSSLAPRARAATPPVGGIKRVVFLTTRYGAVGYHWFPGDEARSERRVSERAVETDLSAFGGDISPVFAAETWNGRLREQLLMLDGLDSKFGIGHMRHVALNGMPAAHGVLRGPSIDQLIASSDALYASAPAYRSLHIKNGRGDHSASSRRDTVTGRISAEPEIAEPNQVWNEVFAGLTGGDATAAERVQLEAENASILDYLSADLERLRSDSRLGRADQLRLSSHLQYVRELELARGAGSMTAATCTPPDMASSYLVEGNYNDSQRGRDHITNIIHAVRCGVTNVVTFAMCPAARTYRDLGANVANFHTTTHNRDGVRETAIPDPNHAAIRQSLIHEKYHASLLAQLMTGLDVVEDEDTGRTFLDNTLVVMTSGMGTCIDHRGTRMPVALAGAKGVLKTGRLLDFRSEFTNVGANWTQFRSGVHYNKLLVSVCKMMGLTTAEYGDSGVGDYTLAATQGNGFPGGMDEFRDYAIGDRHELLPELLV